MNKILFVIPEFTHGGSNKSLENILSLVDKSQFDLYVYSLSVNEESQWYAKVFNKCLIEQGSLYKSCVRNTILRKGLNAIKNFLGVDLWQIIYRIETTRIQRRYKFDTVVGFLESYATHFASHFDTQKIAWIHCDYNDYKVRSNNLDETKWYKQFDNIIGVSEYTTKVFVSNYPIFRDKTVCIYNLLNVEYVRKQAEQTVDDLNFDTRVFSLVSVGRFAEVKQFHRIPEIVKTIKANDKKISFKWYIIGDGDEWLISLTKNLIEEYNIAENVILLGAKNNPYPYIKKANLLVSTSRSEACPYVVNEAKALHTPVVSVDYPSAQELINSDFGIISSFDKLPSVLSTLIKDDNGKYTSLKVGADVFEYSNADILQRLTTLFY